MGNSDWICVVEDDHEIRSVLEELLTWEGHSVKSVANGREALELLSDSQGLPSLILLDLMMPVMSGWEFLEAARKIRRLSGIPVVIMSAIMGDPRIKDLKASAFLKKPVNVEELLELIENHGKPAPSKAEGAA